MSSLLGDNSSPGAGGVEITEPDGRITIDGVVYESKEKAIHALTARGDEAVKENRLDLAEKAYLAVLDISPWHHQAYCQLGFVYRSQGRQADAERHFRQVLDRKLERKHHIEAAWNFFRISRAYCDVHDFAKAEQLVRDALSDPERVSNFNAFTRLGLWLELATVLEARGESDEATKLRRQLADELATARANGILIWGDPGSFDRIVQLESELRTSDPFKFDDFRLRLEEAWAAASGDFDRALVARVYGLAHERTESVEQAIEWYETAAKLRVFYNEMYHGDWVESHLVDCYVKNDDLPRAVVLFRQLLADREKTLHPKNPALAFTRVRLAQVLVAQQKDFKRALVLLVAAQDVLNANALTPDEVKNEIASQIADVQARIEG